MEHGGLPSGKRLHNYGKSLFQMGKLTISMAIFNSYVSLPEGRCHSLLILPRHSLDISHCHGENYQIVGDLPVLNMAMFHCYIRVPKGT